MLSAKGTDQSIQLRDGRKLGFRLLGDSGDKTLFFFHGMPGSRIQADFLSGAIEPDIRIVGVDRPGIGLTDPRPNGHILDWVDDLTELADTIKAARFAVLGWSGGSACALARAYKIPDRLIGCGITAGMGPPALKINYEMARNRIFSIVARSTRLAQFLIWLTYGRFGRNPKQIEQRMIAMQPSIAEIDRAAYANPAYMGIMVDSIVESYRQGVWGQAYESHLLGLPWGFRLEDIRCPRMFIWHGNKDRNIPVAVGQTLATLIPGC